MEFFSLVNILLDKTNIFTEYNRNLYFYYYCCVKLNLSY